MVLAFIRPIVLIVRRENIFSSNLRGSLNNINLGQQFKNSSQFQAKHLRRRAGFSNQPSQ